MQFSISTIVAAAALLPQLASAHYYWPTLIVNGVTSSANQYVRKSTQGYQPQLTPGILTSNDFRCNSGSFAAASSTKVASVKSGSSVSFVTDFNAKIQHPGPISFWMSKATSGDVTKYEGDGDWFKVGVLGYDTPFTSTGDNWRSWNLDTFNVTIPTSVPNGQYLLRIEHIAMHKPSARELYFSCAQIEVTGSSSTTAPTSTTKIPGQYSASDAAITFNMYGNPTSYTFGGPALISGGQFNSQGKDSTSKRSVEFEA